MTHDNLTTSRILNQETIETLKSSMLFLDGVKAQSRVSVNEVADIYVTMDMYGRNGVILFKMAEGIKKTDGVQDS